jgi:hypothetical protein
MDYHPRALDSRRIAEADFPGGLTPQPLANLSGNPDHFLGGENRVAAPDKLR